MTAAADVGTIAPGWLRGRGFDLAFIVGIASLALLSGAVVVQEPRLFVPILFLDLWLLGYHHVVATYTRLCFDRESLRTHRFLVIWLPLIVLAAVLLLARGIGLWVLASIYLYWQWFHYTRQSYGLAQVYRRKAGGLVGENEWLGKLAIYLLPLWGILHRSHQNPGEFLFLELRVIPVPEIAADAAGAATVLVLLWWAFTRVQMWRRGALPLAHTLYMLSHLAIFFVGYIVVEDITHGWLVINVWHNAQYIAFVWMYNNNRFRGGIDPKAKILSTISQQQNAWRYFLVCFSLSTVMYFTLENAVSALPMMVVIYQAVNFHHYVVDGVIWKVRRKKLQKNLGLAS